jgi:hypothetical protein
MSKRPLGDEQTLEMLVFGTRHDDTVHMEEDVVVSELHDEQASLLGRV